MEDIEYRLVSKKYYCYVCNKQQKKMVQVQELLNNGFLCDSCGQGFCEIIEGEEKCMMKELSKGKMHTSEGPSMIDTLQEQANVPPKVTNKREDIRNTNVRCD
jgi:transcription elongation factor Elf1